MDWLLVFLAALAAYLAVAAVLNTYKILPHNIVFYGPILGIKTESTNFFDWFKKFSRPLRWYGNIGILMVIVISVLMVVMLILSVDITMMVKPEPGAIHKPQNLFLIPGVNEFVPSTIAVWVAFIMTLVVHEFGHGILCRIENIAVKSMGVLFLIIPIGAFVEPNEEEVNKSPSFAKMRMYGAGIMNNMVTGIICFSLMIFMIGFAVPTNEPVVVGVYQNFSADSANVSIPSILRTIEGASVSTVDDVGIIMNNTAPGDTIRVGFEKDNAITEYDLTLSEWPEQFSNQTSGFMGIYYYDGNRVISAVQHLFSPLGFFYLISVPFNPSMEGQSLKILGFDLVDTSYYSVPFPGYWELLHLFFWGGFINFAAGLFNALPMLPLDGGLIFKEGVERLLARRNLEKYASQIVGMTSSMMLVLLIALLTLPYLLHL